MKVGDPEGRFCEWCGSHWIGKIRRGRPKTVCSPQCRRISQNVYNRRRNRRAVWETRRPCERCGEPAASYRSKHCPDCIENAVEGRACRGCFGHYVVPVTSGVMFCSKACGTRHQNRFRIKGMTEEACNRCGAEYERRRDNYGGFCSQTCSAYANGDVRRWQALRRAMCRPPYLVPRFDMRLQRGSLRRSFNRIGRKAECEWCGKVYKGKLSLARYCSDVCSYTAADKRRNWKPRMCECRECGASFTPEYGDHRRAFCSGRCSGRWANRNRRSESHRARARRAGVDYEPIRSKLVFERDGWMCGICGGKIWKHTKAPHPKSASLDHIMPISLGGGHVHTNVQAAHFWCNSKKGNRAAGSQLLLMG